MAGFISWVYYLCDVHLYSRGDAILILHRYDLRYCALWTRCRHRTRPSWSQCLSHIGQVYPMPLSQVSFHIWQITEQVITADTLVNVGMGLLPAGSVIRCNVWQRAVGSGDEVRGGGVSALTCNVRQTCQLEVYYYYPIGYIIIRVNFAKEKFVNNNSSIKYIFSYNG